MNRETLQLEYDHFGDNHFEFVDKKKNRRVGLRQIARSHMELERQLAEAKKENKKLNNIIEMLCPKAHTPIKE